VGAWPCRLPPRISAGLSRRATPTPRSRNPKEAISAFYADAMKSSLLRDSVPGARQEAPQSSALRLCRPSAALRRLHSAERSVPRVGNPSSCTCRPCWRSRRDFRPVAAALKDPRPAELGRTSGHWQAADGLWEVGIARFILKSRKFCCAIHCYVARSA
jgi:hypothetical protein